MHYLRQNERVAGSPLFVSYSLVKLKAECCFAGISVQLSHVQRVQPAFHRLLLLAVRQRERGRQNTEK